MRAAARVHPRAGGLERARVFTHLWLALFGLWSWERVPALPPEIILLPSWVPLNVYDFACWARQTIVALSLVKAHRPVRALPFGLDELRARRPHAGVATARTRWRTAPAGLALAALARRLDRIAARLRAPADRPAAPARRRARRALDRAPPGGRRLLGRDPAAVGLLADRAAPRRLSARSPRDEARPRGSRALHGRGPRRLPRRRAHRPGASRRLEACQSPVWDTALAMHRARATPGCRGEHPAMARAAEWLLERGGDACAATGRSRGPALPRAAGRSSSPTSTTPTSTTPPRSCSRCSACGRGGRELGAARCGRSQPRRCAGSRGCRAPSGGWGAFDADNTRSLVRELPFLDFGEVIDEPSADVTAHAVEMLAALGLADAPAARRGRAVADRPAGARRVVVRALGRQPRVRHRRGGARADRRRRGPVARVHPARRAVAARSTRTKTAAGARTRAPTTTRSGSGAARAPPRRPRGRCSRCTPPGGSARRQARWRAEEPALRWLVAHASAWPRGDGTWDEPQYTGTGFPSDYYINYHLYRLTFPVMALGRCLEHRAR